MAGIADGAGRARMIVAAVLAAALLLAGCARAADYEDEQPDEKPPLRLVEIPDLRGKTVSEARELMRSQGVTVLLRFPAVNATEAVPARRIAGALKPSGIKTYRLAEGVYPIGETGFAARAKHRIASQEPKSGTPMSSVTTLTLTVGDHPFTKQRPWFFTHAARVKGSGANSCFNCHRETNCSLCHVMLKDDKVIPRGPDDPRP